MQNKAIIIPSGEGKTWLAKEKPDMFFDSDELMDWRQGTIEAKLLEDEEWTKLSQIYKERLVIYRKKIGERIILASSSDSLPEGYAYEVHMLKAKTGIRYNEGNREKMLSVETKIQYHDTFIDRNRCCEKYAKKDRRWIVLVSVIIAVYIVIGYKASLLMVAIMMWLQNMNKKNEGQKIKTE